MTSIRYMQYAELAIQTLCMSIETTCVHSPLSPIKIDEFDRFSSTSWLCSHFFFSVHFQYCGENAIEALELFLWIVIKNDWFYHIAAMSICIDHKTDQRRTKKLQTLSKQVEITHRVLYNK